MCILCVASRWSRRIVTMLPWLIIPLIILWALSQLLPPKFQFEVTSPRLACVGVLLVSLGWYELAMPRLSMWRARRSAFLRERRRLEAQEAAKLRKEATRRCRNCLSAYRDQAPAGGKFMCTYCGHVSRRPVLDVPSGGSHSNSNSNSNGNVAAAAAGGSPGGVGGGNGGVHSPPAAGGMFSSGSGARGGDGRAGPWGGRGWPERLNPPLNGVNRGWTSGNHGSHGARGSSFFGGPYGSSWSPHWGGDHGVAHGANGGNYGGGYFGKEKCGGGGGDEVSIFRVFPMVFVCFRWLGQIVWRGERANGEDPANGGRGRGSQRREDTANKEGSRGEKARRKAQEKRQARIEREQLEAEERRQREEVARLVEERRRLRDEKLEAEKESEREAAAERERELRREREAERRRQEKVKEKDRANREGTEEELTDLMKKESKKKESKVKVLNERKPSVSEVEKKVVVEGMMKPLLPSQNSNNSGGEFGKKLGGKVGRVDLGVKNTGDAKMAGVLKAARNNVKGSSPVIANPKSHNADGTSFWGKGFSVGAKPAKGVATTGIAGTQSTQSPCTNGVIPNGKHSETGYSAWKRMPWTNVWGKASSPAPVSDKPATLSGIPNNVEMQPANNHCLDRGNWRQAADYSNDSDSLPDLERERDLICQSAEGTCETLFSQGLNSTNYVAPIGPQPPIHAPVSGVLGDRGLNSQEPLSRPILEPWADDINSSGRRIGFDPGSKLLGVEAASGDGKWKMWEAPQFDQFQLPSVTDTSSPAPWMLAQGQAPKTASPCGTAVSAELEPQLPACLFSTKAQNDTLNCTMSSPLSSHSLWSDQSAFVFNSPMPNWDTSDTLLQQPHVPPEFVDCITQEVMQDPVITADGHSYERSAILRWLQTHDTSPMTGEVMPPPPGGNMGVDKTLRPNHILRGQIIEYRENLSRLQRGSGVHVENIGVWDSSSSWSTGLGSTAWSNLPANNTERLNNIGGFYTIPSAQSVWSYNAS